MRLIRQRERDRRRRTLRHKPFGEGLWEELREEGACQGRQERVAAAQELCVTIEAVFMFSAAKVLAARVITIGK